jgi:hypothetical protein
MTPPRHWQNAAIAVFTLAVTLMLSGCNMSQSAKSNTNNNGTGNQVATHVGLSVSSLDFGNVTTNTTKTMHVSLTNSTAAGGASITVSQVKVTGTGFSTSSASNLELAPGQSTDIAVAFKPTAAGTASGNLTIDVIGATDPASVPLDGNGTTTTPSGQLALTPAQLSFGSVNVGSTKNLTETVQASNADVKISSAAWNGAGYSVSGITFPVTVKAGTSKSFTVTFAPQIAGTVTGNLSMTSDAANSPAASTFSGTGAQVAQQHVVNLNWAASSSTVSGYNVYRGTQSGGPYAKVNSSLRTATSYADSSVQSGHVYFYVATAVDASSNESTYSAEVAATVPTP